MKTIYRNFKIMHTSTDTFLICFVPGVRNSHKLNSNEFSTLNEARREIDFRFLALRNEGKYYNGIKIVDFDFFADYEIDSEQC